jgi:hypothetical protein
MQARLAQTMTVRTDSRKNQPDGLRDAFRAIVSGGDNWIIPIPSELTGECFVTVLCEDVRKRRTGCARLQTSSSISPKHRAGLSGGLSILHSRYVLASRLRSGPAVRQAI